MAKAKASGATWWLIAVLLLAFAARVYRIDHQSFWNDEGNSASLSSRSVPLILEGTASDVHPPLYYLILRAWWPLAGQNDFSLRIMSAVSGLIQVAASIAIGRLWLSQKGAIAVGLFVALSPPLIYYSQEARMYGLLGAIATCSMLVLFRGLKKGNSHSKLAYSAVFAILTALGLYTHYVYPAVIAAQGLIVINSFEGPQRMPSLDLVTNIFNQFWHWLAAVGVALLAYLPWLPIFLRTGSSTRVAGDALAADFLQETAQWLALGPFAVLNPLWLMGVIFTGVYFAIGVFALLGVKFRQRIMVALIWLTIPIFLMQAVGATDENYRKFLTVVVPAVYLVIVLAGEWLDEVTPLVRGSNVVWGVVFILPILTLGVWDLYENPLTFRDDYKGIAELIGQEGRENSAVILNAPNQWEVFSWYMGDSGSQTFYPMPKSRRPDEQIKAEVEAVLASHNFVYALFWGFEGFDPNRMVERTLDERAFKSTDEWYGDVRLVTYGVLGDFLPDETNRPDLELYESFLLSDGETNSGIQFNWAEVSGLEFRPGDVIGLAIEWEALDGIEARYKVFVHLLDGNGQLVAQRDAEPVGNLKPTDGWQSGEIVLDQHGLLIPASLPPGEYELMMGLYEVLGSNSRLLIGTDKADVKSITNLTVR